MGFFSDQKHEQTLLELEGRLASASAENRQLQARLDAAEELVRHQDEDRDLLLKALNQLRPGMEPWDLAEALMGICFKPLGLASFFVARARWEEDLLEFVLYHEGGKIRSHPSRPLSARAGLSERVLTEGHSIYIRTLEEGKAVGSLLTAAEEATGLIPHSWYGVPLGWGLRPSGLVSFQSFQPDAFSDHRRQVMDGLAALLSTCWQGESGT
ncbi:MAG TPA: hypothetical protein VJ486_07635 [Geothrix sp.]|nr:hypothetical protein [Geothrix sp.]